MASLGFAVRLNRARILLVRQETESGRPAGLRVDPHDFPVFHFQHHSSCRNRGHAHSRSLFRQILSSAEQEAQLSGHQEHLDVS